MEKNSQERMFLFSGVILMAFLDLISIGMFIQFCSGDIPIGGCLVVSMNILIFTVGWVSCCGNNTGRLVFGKLLLWLAVLFYMGACGIGLLQMLNIL